MRDDFDDFDADCREDESEERRRYQWEASPCPTCRMPRESHDPRCPDAAGDAE